MRARGYYLGALCACLALVAGASPASASRALITEEAVLGKQTPAGQIEDACGVATAAGQVFVSDYYHGVINVFSGAGFQSQISLESEPKGPCELAISPAGALYANYYHQGVVRLEPSVVAFDEGNSTGVAVDPSANVYVNRRTYVAAFQPSAAPLLFEGQPLRIGLGSLGDGYGLAVSSFSATKGEVYVADASDDTIKVYEPTVDPDDPRTVIDGSATLQGGFVSLADAALAIDPTNGHLLVADNLQPGYEHPEAAVDEFSPAGVFLGQLKKRLIDAQPPGLAFDDLGNLYATSGNDEGAAVFRFGPYSASGPEATVSPTATQEILSKAAPAPEAAAAVEAGAGLVSPTVPSALRHRAHKKGKRHHHRRANRTKK